MHYYQNQSPYMYGNQSEQPQQQQPGSEFPATQGGEYPQPQGGYMPKSGSPPAESQEEPIPQDDAPKSKSSGPQDGNRMTAPYHYGNFPQGGQHAPQHGHPQHAQHPQHPQHPQLQHGQHTQPILQYPQNYGQQPPQSGFYGEHEGGEYHNQQFQQPQSWQQ